MAGDGGLWALGVCATPVRERHAIVSAAVNLLNAATRGWARYVMDWCLDAAQRLTGAGNALNTRPLAAWWATHTVADLSCIQIEFGQGAAEGVAVHA